jgi:hypothetical protein
MTVIAFDTLAFANKLKGAGMNATLAEVQAEETAKILNDLAENHVATKKDLHELKLDMYAFMVKVATFTVGILGGIQALFHFIK